MHTISNHRWKQLITELNINPETSENEKKSLLKLCNQYNNLFFLKGDKLSYTKGITHKIQTRTDLPPINQKNYRLPQLHKDVINETVQELLDNNIIEHSNSPWNSPLLVVDKKGGPDGQKKHRVVVDFRKLNSQTIGDAYPLPRIDDILDQLSQAKYFTTLDLASGYHQVLIHEEDREKTAFSTPIGHLHFLRMAFGLKGGPATFQRLMDQTLKGLLGKDCFVYLDDIVVYSNTIKEHIDKLQRIFERLSIAELKLQPQKCHFYKREIIYLGHKCSEKGCEPDPEKTKAIQNIMNPKTIKEIQSFLGIANYYRRFIPEFAKIALPLVKLTRKNTPFKWTDECNAAFERLKEILISNNVLSFPDFTKPFEISTDASNEALGAVLSQEEKPIAFASKTLNTTESKYSTIEKELLGVVWAVKRFRCYVYGTTFTVYTDHKPLLGIYKMKDPSSRLLRLYLKLSEYSITLEYKPGKHNTIADGLSRLPTQVNVITRAQARKLQAQEVETNSEDEYCTSNNAEDSESEWEDIEEVIDEETFQNVEEKDQEWEDIEEFYKHEQPIKITKPKHKKEILFIYHDSKIGGHQGINKTYQKIKRRYKWPKMKKEIEKYIKTCNICQLNKSGKSTKMKMVLVKPANFPFEKIYLDIVGPLPMTEDGNKYILTIMDDLSRYMNGYAIPDQEATTITHTFVSQILGHHKTPKIILTDQGSNFTSKLFKKVCKLFNIKKIQTTPYHPETNGALERHHKPLADYLRSFSKSNSNNWDQLLPYAMYTHNNSINAATKIAPNDCLFGYISEMPSKLKRSPGVQYNFDCTYSNIKHELYKVWKWVRMNQEKYKEITKLYYDKKHYEQSFTPGSKVYIRNEARKNKLSPLWTGPHQVVAVKSKVTTIVRIRKQIKAVHNNRLKPHYPRK